MMSVLVSYCYVTSKHTKNLGTQQKAFIRLMHLQVSYMHLLTSK